jgi:hypothetical protein
VADKSISQLSDKELEAELSLRNEINSTKYPQLKAEFDKRQAKRNARYILASSIAAAIAALGSMIAAVVSVIGIFHGK